MSEEIKVRIGDLLKLKDGTIVVCRKASLKEDACNKCYFNNCSNSCSRICTLGVRMHFKEIKRIHAIKGVKLNQTNNYGRDEKETKSR